MRAITNDIPQILLDLAREAVALGFERVAIGQGGGSGDKVSSPEWMLHLIKNERHHSNDKTVTAHINVSRSRSSNPKNVTAYVGCDVSGTDNPYYTAEDIRAWMLEPIASDPNSEYSYPWNPTLDETRQASLLTSWDHFKAGVLSGWSMTHSVKWGDLFMTNRSRARAELEPLTTPNIGIEWHMTNSFYNKKGHPAYRKNKNSRLYISGWMTVYPDDNTRFIARSTEDAPHFAEITEAEMTEILGTTAPWFVRISGVKRAEKNAWRKSDEGMAAAIADNERAIALSSI